ncbi:hypothetical protein VTN02DRAFT_5425 [Thermoascus thermophilus]
MDIISGPAQAIRRNRKSLPPRYRFPRQDGQAIWKTVANRWGAVRGEGTRHVQRAVVLTVEFTKPKSTSARHRAHLVLSHIVLDSKPP